MATFYRDWEMLVTECLEPNNVARINAKSYMPLSLIKNIQIGSYSVCLSDLSQSMRLDS